MKLVKALFVFGLSAVAVSKNARTGSRSEVPQGKFEVTFGGRPSGKDQPLKHLFSVVGISSDSDPKANPNQRTILGLKFKHEEEVHKPEITAESKDSSHDSYITKYKSYIKEGSKDIYFPSSSISGLQIQPSKYIFF